MTALSLRLPSATPCDLLHAVALATGMPMAYLRWPGGHCLWATAAYAQLLAMPTQELQGKAPQNYLKPCDWDDWQCALARVADVQTPGASVHTPRCLLAPNALPRS